MTSMPFEAAREPLSVSDAAALIKQTVEGMPTLLVIGEVSGFRGPARTGHCYFQLKDEAASVDAIVWRGVYQSSGIELRDGLQVVIAGGFQVYTPTGRLSCVAKRIEVSGEGLLRQQVAALAKRLEAEGLMDASRKRRIPAFCTRVAVVTSPTGSVIDDVKRTLARRNPLVEILISGCAVQGEGAPQQIIHALDRAVAAHPEAILLVRGGGSYEDLMTFNDETLARAVASCPIPVVTGIGHEPDTCICDMVADRRCSTPTAAAESVAPAFDEILRSFRDRESRLARAMGQIASTRRQMVDVLGDRATHSMDGLLRTLSNRVDALAAHHCLQDPLAPLTDQRQQLELTAQRLHDAAPRSLERRRAERDELEGRFHAARTRMLGQRTKELRIVEERLLSVGPRVLRPYESVLEHSAAQLEALSPLKVLGRGYAIARDAAGHVIADAQELRVGDELHVTLAKGVAHATVTGTTETREGLGA